MFVPSVDKESRLGVVSTMLVQTLCIVSLAVALVSCGSGNNSHTLTAEKFSISGTVAGLAGSGLVLQNNAGDDLSVASNGSFTFATPAASSAAYTVTVKTQPTNPSQTCKVNNGNGTVPGASVSSVAVICSTNSYTVGGTVTGLAGSGLVLQNNLGDDLNIATNESFTFTIPVASDADYAVTVKAQPRMLSQKCEVTGGTGVMVSSPVSDITVNCVTPTPRFALVSRASTSSVTVFAIDASTGSLSLLSTATTGSGAAFLAVDPSMKFAYVANANDNNISAYQIDPATGALTSVTGSPFATGSQPNYIAFDPSGMFAYVSNSGSGNVSVYAVNTGTGALTEVFGSPFAGSRALQIAPSGEFAYGMGPSRVDTFAVDPSTGRLSSSVGSIAADPGANNFAMDPAGRFIYTPYYSSSGSATTYVGGFAVTDVQTGALAAVPGSPFAAGAGVNWAAVDPTGRFVYAVNLWSRNVMSYTIDSATGALANVDTDPTEPSPDFVTVDPSGRYVYVANDWGSISTFAIDGSTGRLNEVGTPYRLSNFGSYGSMAIAIVTQ